MSLRFNRLTVWTAIGGSMLAAAWAQDPFIDIRSADHDVAFRAAIRLEAMGAAALPALNDLRRQLFSPLPDLQMAATRVICRLGPPAFVAIPDLVKMAEQEKSVWSEASANLCGSPEGGFGASAIPVWLKEVKPGKPGELWRMQRNEVVFQALVVSGAEGYPYLISAIRQGGAQAEVAARAIQAEDGPAGDAEEFVDALIFARRRGMHNGVVIEFLARIRPVLPKALVEVRSHCRSHDKVFRKRVHEILRAMEGEGSNGCGRGSVR